MMRRTAHLHAVTQQSVSPIPISIERFQQNYNVGLNWKPFKNITFRSEFGYGWKYNNTDQVWGSNATTNSKYGYNGQPQAQFVRLENKNWRNANTLTYDNKKLFHGRDHINVLVGRVEQQPGRNPHQHFCSLPYFIHIERGIGKHSSR